MLFRETGVLPTMNNHQHTVLCVDDEKNVLQSLKRLLRREEYCLLTATSGAEGLKILEENDVHLVISDQRMPLMSGTEFLAKVKERYPSAIRIILTGYTDVETITESINKGHVYKFFLKPWNDQSLKLEIKQALEYYDLTQVNKMLHEKIVEQNEELKQINERLEELVQERTRTLEIQNQALELSRAILQDLPLPILGVSAEGMIVLINNETAALSWHDQGIELGKEITAYFSTDVREKIADVLKTGITQTLKGYLLSDTTWDIDLIPLSKSFAGKGVIMMFK